MNYTCANRNCGMELQDLRAANHVLAPPQVGDLVLCGGCGHPSKITLTGTALLTPEEFDAMHPDDQRDLDFAQRAIKRKIRQS